MRSLFDLVYCGSLYRLVYFEQVCASTDKTKHILSGKKVFQRKKVYLYKLAPLNGGDTFIINLT